MIRLILIYEVSPHLRITSPHPSTIRPSHRIFVQIRRQSNHLRQSNRCSRFHRKYACSQLEGKMIESAGETVYEDRD